MNFQYFFLSRFFLFDKKSKLAPTDANLAAKSQQLKVEKLHIEVIKLNFGYQIQFAAHQLSINRTPLLCCLPI